MILLLMPLLLITTEATFGAEFMKDGYDLSMQGSPRHLRCKDENLQRTLSWTPRKAWKHESFIRYQIQFTTLSSKNYRNISCYKNEERTIELTSMLKSTFCKTSVAELIPWSYLRFRVRAQYRTRHNNTEVLTDFTEKVCEPILDRSTYTAPQIQIDERGVDFLKINFTLPYSLKNSIKSLGNAFENEFEIQEEYCAIPGLQKSDCDVRVCENGQSVGSGGGWKEANGHDRLKSGTPYCVWGRYSTEYNEERHSNISELQFTSTLSDDQTGKIALAISLCAIIVFIIVCFIIVRMVYRRVQKMKKMINGDLPKKMNDLKTEMGKKENPFFTTSQSIYEDNGSPADASEDLSLLLNTGQNASLATSEAKMTERREDLLVIVSDGQSPIEQMEQTFGNNDYSKKENSLFDDMTIPEGMDSSLFGYASK